MNLLDRARRLLKGSAPAHWSKPQIYRVACPEGHVLSGQRTEGYQALRCPTCGEGIFVLPRSPLPEPPPPPRSKPEGLAFKEDVAEIDEDAVSLTDPPEAAFDPGPEMVGDIEWETTPPPPQPAAHTEKKKAGHGQENTQRVADGTDRRREGRSTEARSKADRPRPEPEGRIRDEVVAAAVVLEREPVGVRLRGWALRNRNPLIFVAVGLVVVATIGYRVRWLNLQDLPQVAELGRTEGLKALDQGQVEKAHQLLSKAKAAVDALGGAVEGADLIRQGADEAAILAQLSAESLESILDQASRKGAEEWPAWFDTYFKGRTIIVDANVTAVPGASGSGGYEFDYRIFYGGSGTKPSGVGRIDATGLRLFELSPPKRGDHARFGARLASLRYDVDRQLWFFGLEPESGVFMTHAKALEAFGWPSGGDLVIEEDAP